MSATGICVEECPQHQILTDGKCACAPGFEPTADQTGCTCAKFLSEDRTSCVSSCPSGRFQEEAYTLHCVASCPDTARFHDSTGRCVVECAGKANEDGLCQNAGGSNVTTVAVVFSCVGVLEVVAAVVIFCLA